MTSKNFSHEEKIMNVLVKYGVKSKEDLKKKVEKMKPLNIGIMTSELKINEEKVS